MYAMLGQIPFEITHSFTSLDITHKAKFVHHDTIAGKPRTQAMGHELDKLKFEMRLHWRLGDVLATYDALKTAQQSQEAQALVTGSGEHLGWYVIESLSAKTTAQSDTGDVLAMDIDVALTEFGGDPNNPLPAPAITRTADPLLAMRTDSIHAPIDIETARLMADVASYHRASDLFSDLQRQYNILRQIKNDPARLLDVAGNMAGTTGAIIDGLQLPVLNQYKDKISWLSTTCEHTQNIAHTLRDGMEAVRSGDAVALGQVYYKAYDGFKSASSGISKLTAKIAMKKRLF